MAEESTKEGDSDVDLYCDLEEAENDSKTNEEFSDCNGAVIPDISTLFSENECKVFFSENGKKTIIKIKKQVDSNEDATVSQSLVKDLDLFTDVVTEKSVQAEQEKLERESLISQNIELKKLNSQLEAELNAVMKKNRTLMKNICALYKTAKEEISRKDALIAELREKNDGMIFRRARLLGVGAGPFRRASKFHAVAADAQQLNGTNSESRTKGQCVTIINSYDDGHPAMEDCSTSGCRNHGQKLSSDISSLSSSGDAHKHNSERRKKLPKAFQDPEKHSRRRHLSHKSYRKRKRSKMKHGEIYSDSEESLESHFSHSRLSGNSSESDAGHLFHETLRELKKSNSSKKQYKKSVLSSEELRHIYSDYQRSLDGPKPRGESREKEKPNFSAPKSGNFNTGNMSCDSEEAITARNNLFKKLLSYERQDSLQEPERKQKDTELKRIISSTSNVEDFTQLYSKYLAQWALSSGDPNTLRRTSGLGDSDEYVACDGENDSDYPGEGDYEEDYGEDYEYYSTSKYVDLDRPNDYFYGAPQKSFYDHLMEEKARQVHMYCAKDYQTSSSSVSKLVKQCDAEEVHSASELPEALRDDSLKLFGYQGKSVPIAIKKKVVGYAKSPKKAAIEKS